MSNRRQSRIMAMQALCQLDVMGQDFLTQLDEFLTDESPDAAARDYARTLVNDAAENIDTLDAAIQTCSQHWELKRMAGVDRAILRMSACELAHQSDVPPKVVIDEAIEIAKLYGTADSPAFINGVLDAILKSRQTPPNCESSNAILGI
jgi:transcription antitermination factor NusB